MPYQNIVFHGLLKQIPWSVLDRALQQHEADLDQRALKAKPHLLAMLFAQLFGSRSLRDIETSLKSHAGNKRKGNIMRVLVLLDATSQNQRRDDQADNDNDAHACPHCGGRMIVIETFERGKTPRHRPSGPMLAVRIDTS